MLPIFSIPLLCLALVAWAAVEPQAAWHTRFPGQRSLRRSFSRVGVMTLRADRRHRGADRELHWRWTPTAGGAAARARQRRSGRAVAAAPTVAAGPARRCCTDVADRSTCQLRPRQPRTRPRKARRPRRCRSRKAEWPGFRGAERDSVVRGVRIDTDWSQNAAGCNVAPADRPGWSSFAVRGERDLHPGAARRRRDRRCLQHARPASRCGGIAIAARFWESNGGAGPRGTPTLSDDGRVYAFGGTGILNALDAASGKAIWSRNVASDTKATVPDWGFSSSPLVVDDLVVDCASRVNSPPTIARPESRAGSARLTAAATARRI